MCLPDCLEYSSPRSSPLHSTNGNVMCNLAVTASWSWKSATAMWLAVSTLTYMSSSEKTRTVMSTTEAIVTAYRSREEHGKDGKYGCFVLLLDFEAPDGRGPLSYDPALLCTQECLDHSRMNYTEEYVVKTTL